MIRTQIQLKEEQYRTLRALGAREDKGLGEQVREAVTLYLSRKSRENLPSLEEAFGRFSPLPPEAMDELKPHDRWWAESILPSKRQ